MNDENTTSRGVVYSLPETDAVSIQRDIEYQKTETGALTMDIFYPPESNREDRIPVIIFVNGYPDSIVQKYYGCKLKDIGSYISWGKLMAARGIVAITYTAGTEPATDIHALLNYTRQNASTLGIDEERIGLWASSANVPNALSMLMHEGRDYLKCAVLCYGLMLDFGKTTYVADAAKQVGFANPCEGISPSHLSPDIPLFIVRAGQDKMPHLNETIDNFLRAGLECNLPITFINHPTAPHFFDVEHDSEITREIIRQILAFMQFHLLV